MLSQSVGAYLAQPATITFFRTWLFFTNTFLPQHALLCTWTAFFWPCSHAARNEIRWKSRRHSLLELFAQAPCINSFRRLKLLQAILLCQQKGLYKSGSLGCMCGCVVVGIIWWYSKQWTGLDQWRRLIISEWPIPVKTTVPWIIRLWCMLIRSWCNPQWPP